MEEHEIDIYNNVLTHDTINQNFESICSEFSHRQCLGYRSKENGQLTPFEWICYEDLDRRVNNFGVGLRTTGLVTGDKVLIISENRPEWIICELACYSCGFITVFFFFLVDLFLVDLFIFVSF